MTDRLTFSLEMKCDSMAMLWKRSTGYLKPFFLPVTFFEVCLASSFCCSVLRDCLRGDGFMVRLILFRRCVVEGRGGLVWNSTAIIQAHKTHIFSFLAFQIQELLLFYTTVKMSEQKWHRNITYYLLGLRPAHCSCGRTSLFNHPFKRLSARHKKYFLLLKRQMSSNPQLHV